MHHMVTRVRRLFTFPLDEDLRLELEAIRERTDAPVAALIRRAIRFWLKNSEEAAGGRAERKRAATRRRS